MDIIDSERQLIAEQNHTRSNKDRGYEFNKLYSFMFISPKLFGFKNIQIAFFIFDIKGLVSIDFVVESKKGM